MKSARIILLIIYISFSIFTISSIEINRFNDTRNQLQTIANTRSSAISYALVTSIERTNIIEVFIMEQKGEIVNFHSVAEQLLYSDGFDSLLVAPKGLVKYAYPEERLNNETAFEADLFENSITVEHARKSENENRTVISKVIPLSNGQDGLMVFNPIYFGDEFWGFTTIMLQIPEVFSSAQLDNLTSRNYLYTLTKGDNLIHTNTDIPLTNPVSSSFELYGETWTLSIEPADGWFIKSAFGLELVSLLFVFILMVTLFKNYELLMEERQKLKYLASRDTLTCLFNRLQLESDINKKLANEEAFILCYMDLNGFKQVNDTYGHSIGDALLVEIANRISKNCLDTDTLYRIGGDEFVAITHDLKQVDVYNEIFNEPFVINGITLQSSLSIGYSIFPEDGTTLDSLIRIADAKMYQNKEKSR